MDREEAGRIVLAKRGDKRWDKRHLYLAREGKITSGGIPRVDQQKRDRAAIEKKVHTHHGAHIAAGNVAERALYPIAEEASIAAVLCLTGAPVSAQPECHSH